MICWAPRSGWTHATQRRTLKKDVLNHSLIWSACVRRQAGTGLADNLSIPRHAGPGEINEASGFPEIGLSGRGICSAGTRDLLASQGAKPAGDAADRVGER